MPNRVPKGSQGFTLIELMIVVAILGILVAIAIPNFMTYQAKARQAEVKAVLGGIFMAASTVMYAQFGSYVITDIGQLGFAPSGIPRYSYWFAVSGAPTPIPGGSTATVPCDVNSAPAGVLASGSGFTAGARGNIDTDSTCDDWLMNDNKILTNTNNDVIN